VQLLKFPLVRPPADVSHPALPESVVARIAEPGLEATERQRVRELAAKIKTEAQFEQILDDAETPEMREAIREMLRPHLRFALSDAVDADATAIAE